MGQWFYAGNVIKNKEVKIIKPKHEEHNNKITRKGKFK